MPLAGRPMVEWSIAALRAARRRALDRRRLPARATSTTSAGTTSASSTAAPPRSQSVANALEAVGTELVAIHDAARPLVTPELVEGVVATLVADPEADGAIAAAPVTDTIKRVGPDDPPPRILDDRARL